MRTPVRKSSRGCSIGVPVGLSTVANADTDVSRTLRGQGRRRYQPDGWGIGLLEGSDRSAPRFDMRTEGRPAGVYPRRGESGRESGWRWKNYPMDLGRCSIIQAPYSQARGLRYARSAVWVGSRAIQGPMLTPTFVSLFSFWPRGGESQVRRRVEGVPGVKTGSPLSSFLSRGELSKEWVPCDRGAQRGQHRVGSRLF